LSTAMGVGAGLLLLPGTRCLDLGEGGCASENIEPEERESLLLLLGENGIDTDAVVRGTGNNLHRHRGLLGDSVGQVGWSKLRKSAR